MERAAALTRDMLRDVMTRLPYWNHPVGTDHFYICAHDMGTEVTRLADSALRKNAIGLVNTADYSEPYFDPHKDISIPPHPGRGTIEWAVIGQGGPPLTPSSGPSWLSWQATKKGMILTPLPLVLSRQSCDMKGGGRDVR